ncbi:uncharacterized protein LOC121728004 [Aricia agestis]|uniref:uncharacterized protein LOC121728004 n=1 Tax=Aricia agestis TaxID=91739 RepID=UPI001C2082CB|nr:uncharacterized protein LOC121728004 [Aricia agestis]
MNLVWCGLALVLCAGQALGHGRLIEPPSRASAWRYGFDTPHNYNDHELYCGGFTRQWRRNGGKCGVCGDAWDAPKPRPHEIGGTFYKGVIVRKYAPGDVITVKVQLTASHMGWFEFKVCDNPSQTDEECMSKHVLKLEGSEATKFYPKNGSVTYEMRYRLPEGLECVHCVFQWQYVAGNNWGECGNGTGAVGCGPQEEFRSCADISISDEHTTTRRPRPSYVPPSRRPTVPTPAETESTGSSVYGIVIAIVSLLLALAVLAAVYLYYYRGGMRIKNLLRKKVPPPAPVPPPRHKKMSLSRENPPEISAPKLISETGFETVDLRTK